jgi:hypothetical protein
VPLPVRADGVVQAVDVPAGTGVLTWTYATPHLAAGLALSATGAAAIGAVLLAAALDLGLAWRRVLQARHALRRRPAAGSIGWGALGRANRVRRAAHFPYR